MKILIPFSAKELAASVICVALTLTALDRCATEIRAQETESVTVKKVISEPVYRVPLVAHNVGPGAVTSPEPIAPATIASTPQPTTEPSTHLAATPSSNVPSMLPSATKVVPSSNASATVPTAPTPEPVAAAPAPHPLDDAVETAVNGLAHIRSTVMDYSAIMVKRERVDGTLQKPEYMQVKVRRGRVADNGQAIPFSIYMKFIKPRATAGREVIWVKGQNDNKLCVHEGSGMMALKRFNLDPDGWLAMKGQRYPIYECGLENLVVKLIEKAERDRAAGHCDVVYRDGVKINGRSCQTIEVTHHEERHPYDFHVAKVYIDDELKLPIRYQAHSWPETPGGKPQLMEEYTYLNVKTNQGFTDLDFSPENPAYKYPGR